MNDDKKFIAQDYLNRLSDVKDPIAQVVTIHLFTEHYLDHMLRSVSKNPDKLPKRMSYKQKLDILNSLISLPEGLYNNICKLNNLRNECAHNLDFDFSNADYNYDLSILNSIARENFGDLSKVNLWNRLMWVGIVTFGWLNNYDHITGESKEL